MLSSRRPISFVAPTITQTHSLAPPSLLNPSSKTYPTVTGLPQPVFPALTPVGAFTNLSVKKAGWRIDESSIARVAIGIGSGRGIIGKASGWKGGIASIWFRGLVEEEEECRMGCWFRGGGGCVCSWKVAG